MRAQQIHSSRSVCEACDKEILTNVISGKEVQSSYQGPIRLCQDCGLIELDIMQYCRELAIGCNDN